MKKGAIFDMDGLMFDTEKIWQKCWTEVADEMKIDLDPRFRKEICGTSGDLMASIISKYYHVEDGHDIAKDVKQRVQNYLMIDVPEKPGVHEILKFFRDNGVKIAVASSSTRGQIQRNLKKTNTEEYIDVIASGTEIEHGKPAPDLFLLAADLLGLAAEDCYVFEDAYNGVQAGAASGAATIMIPDSLEPNEEMRAITAGIYPSLLAAMKAISKGEI
ncbi:MAG: HAD family phosphatase [Solobacterium sp.]|nr:HAD family phosphatase [Solobacterium sp.]